MVTERRSDRNCDMRKGKGGKWEERRKGKRRKSRRESRKLRGERGENYTFRISAIIRSLSATLFMTQRSPVDQSMILAGSGPVGLDGWIWVWAWTGGRRS